MLYVFSLLVVQGLTEYLISEARSGDRYSDDLKLPVVLGSPATMVADSYPKDTMVASNIGGGTGWI